MVLDWRAGLDEGGRIQALQLDLSLMVGGAVGVFWGGRLTVCVEGRLGVFWGWEGV